MTSSSLYLKMSCSTLVKIQGSKNLANILTKSTIAEKLELYIALVGVG